MLFCSQCRVQEIVLKKAKVLLIEISNDGVGIDFDAFDASEIRLST